MNFKTGSKNLDRLLQGGYPSGAISTIMGEAGTGRTTLCLAASVAAVRRKKRVVYFDCESSITTNATFNLDLTPDYFNTVSPSSLEECLDVALRTLKLKDLGLLVLDSPTVLSSNRGSVASVAGMFTNWMPKALSALSDTDKALLIGWQLRRPATRTERKSANFGEPLALGHGTSVSLLLERTDGGVEVSVRKDRRDVVHATPPSCIIKFTGGGLFEDLRVANEPIDRSKIPSRFDRDEVI